MSQTPSRDFTRVGLSRIQGRGVFAKRRIPRGTRIFEYTGEHRLLSSLLDDVGDAESHTYKIRLSDQVIIDGAIGGNDSRFINHGCDPNCEVYNFDDKLYIYAGRDIVRGEELTFDYKLGYAFGTPDGAGEKLRCRCGAANCRGTMLAEVEPAAKPVRKSTSAVATKSSRSSKSKSDSPTKARSAKTSEPTKRGTRK